MLLKNRFFYDNKIVSSCVILFISKFVPVVSRIMDNNSMTELTIEQIPTILKRLQEAERRAKLLKNEIKDIQRQITVLTSSANDIFSSSKASTIAGIKRTRLIPSTSSPEASTSKRPLDESDSLNIDPSKRIKGNEDIPKENGYAVVYTDGACENNGKAIAKAGIGVWFSHGNPLNISEPVIGRATNNTAEIQAATEALKVLQNLGYKKAKLFTDSRFTINCITVWIKKWKLNNWKLANGGPVKNKEDLIKLDTVCRHFDDIKWEYCPGHKGVIGNEEADKLAVEGAKRYVKV